MNQPEMADVGFDEEEVFDNDVGEENTEVGGAMSSVWCPARYPLTDHVTERTRRRPSSTR
jgi:hypothetical protein